MQSTALTLSLLPRPSSLLPRAHQPAPTHPQDRALLAEYTHSGEIYELTWHPHGRQLAVCGGTEEVAVVPLALSVTGLGGAGARGT